MLYVTFYTKWYLPRLFIIKTRRHRTSQKNSALELRRGISAISSRYNNGNPPHDWLSPYGSEAYRTPRVSFKNRKWIAIMTQFIPTVLESSFWSEDTVNFESLIHAIFPVTITTLSLLYTFVDIPSEVISIQSLGVFVQYLIPQKLMSTNRLLRSFSIPCYFEWPTACHNLELCHIFPIHEWQTIARGNRSDAISSSILASGLNQLEGYQNWLRWTQTTNHGRGNPYRLPQIKSMG